MNKYLIIGTDTDCGKTFVTCQWLQTLKQQGKTAIALKPIATGCNWQGDNLVSPDAKCHEQYSSEKISLLPPWRYFPPVSPHLAAEETINISEVIAYCNHKEWDKYEVVLIESAGGLMSPINNDATWVDFLVQSRIPAVLVVGMKLGCLNHALLTADVLTKHGIKCTGWIANCLDPNYLYLDENIDYLKQKLEYPLLDRSDKITTLFT